jgi:hypothetical protein
MEKPMLSKECTMQRPSHPAALSGLFIRFVGTCLRVLALRQAHSHAWLKKD